MVYDSVRGMTVLFGGYDVVSGYSLGDTWEWDGTGWVQRTAQTSPPARSMHAMAYDPARGVTVLLGGTGNYGHLDDTWEWDGVDWVQRTPLASPSVRYSSAMAFDGTRGVTVLFGGGYYSGGFRYLNDTWQYGSSLHWTVYVPIVQRAYQTAP